MLDLMRDNEAAVQDISSGCQDLLREAVRHLKILDPEHGDAELIMAVAAELAKLSLPQRGPGAFLHFIAPTPPLTPTSPLKKCDII